MIEGHFGEEGKLYFEIDLIAADGDVVIVNALLDTIAFYFHASMQSPPTNYQSHSLN